MWNKAIVCIILYNLQAIFSTVAKEKGKGYPSFSPFESFHPHTFMTSKDCFGICHKITVNTHTKYLISKYLKTLINMVLKRCI